MVHLLARRFQKMGKLPDKVLLLQSAAIDAVQALLGEGVVDGLALRDPPAGDHAACAADAGRTVQKAAASLAFRLVDEGDELEDLVEAGDAKVLHGEVADAEAGAGAAGRRAACDDCVFVRDKVRAVLLVCPVRAAQVDDEGDAAVKEPGDAGVVRLAAAEEGGCDIGKVWDVCGAWAEEHCVAHRAAGRVVGGQRRLEGGL